MTYADLPSSHFRQARQYAVMAACASAKPLSGRKGSAAPCPMPSTERMPATISRQCFTPLRSRISDSSANSKISTIRASSGSPYRRKFHHDRSSSEQDAVNSTFQNSFVLHGRSTDESRGLAAHLLARARIFQFRPLVLWGGCAPSAQPLTTSAGGRKP